MRRGDRITRRTEERQRTEGQGREREEKWSHEKRIGGRTEKTEEKDKEERERKSGVMRRG